MNRTFRTARCIISSGDTFLMVVHQGGYWASSERWGFPGGRLDRGESPEACVRRELREELAVEADHLAHVGDYRYKGSWHRIFGTVYEEAVTWFDEWEIVRLGWLTRGDVAKLDRQKKLHAGFELQALERFEVMQDINNMPVDLQ